MIEDKRALTFWDALAIGVGATVGPGIFTVMGPLVAASGSAAPLAFALSGASLLFSVYAHSRLAADLPDTGGLYVYARHAFGAAGGFLVGWSFILSAAAAGSFVSLGFADHLAGFVPVNRLWAALGLAILYVIINWFRVRVVAFVQKLVTGLTIGATVMVVGAGMLRGHLWSQGLPAVGAPSSQQFMQGVLLTFTLFAGFEVIGGMAGEVSRPRRTLPRSMFGTLFIATLVYVGVAAVSVSTYDPAFLAASPTPVAAVAQRLLGPVGWITAGVGVLLASGSVLNGQLLVISRILSAMAGDGILPRGATRFGVAVTAAGGLVASIVLLFPSIGFLAGVSSLIFLLALMSTNLAYLKLNRRRSPGSVLGYVGLFSPVVFLLGVRWQSVGLTAGWVLAGILLYWWRFRNLETGGCGDG